MYHEKRHKNDLFEDRFFAEVSSVLDHNAKQNSRRFVSADERDDIDLDLNPFVDHRVGTAQHRLRIAASCRSRKRAGLRASKLTLMRRTPLSANLGTKRSSCVPFVIGGRSSRPSIGGD